MFSINVFLGKAEKFNISINFRHQKYETKLKELNLPQYSFKISGKEGN